LFSGISTATRDEDGIANSWLPGLAPHFPDTRLAKDAAKTVGQGLLKNDPK
jgi:hypothetical protein